MSVKVRVGDNDQDGICLATVSVDNVEHFRFEATQAEMKELALRAGGFVVPRDLAHEAEAERARRESLGRTLFEEIVAVAEVTLTPPRSCRVCGCTDISACVAPDGTPCHWVEPDLCSQCNARQMAD